MDEKKLLSRELFKKISSITTNLIGFSDLERVWTCLYLSNIELNKSVYSSLVLAKSLKIFNDQYSGILYTNIINKIVGFVVNKNFYETPFPTDLMVVNTDQSSYILNSYLKNVKSALDNYLNGDEEFYFIYNKDSLEALFATLTTNLQKFKKFYRADALNSFITYKHLESIIRETANDRNNYIDGLDKSILLNNVNIDNPVSSNDIPEGTTWKELFVDFKDICKALISANEIQFYIRNVIYNSVNRAVSNQESQYNQIINFGTNYELEAEPVLDSQTKRQLNKILITAKINDNDLYSNGSYNSSNGSYDLNKIKTKFSNRSVFYYNYTNRGSSEPRKSFLTRSKIIGVDLLDNDKKIHLTLSPFNGFNDKVKSVSFPLNDEGIFFEKPFPTLNTINQDDPPMTFNINSRDLFTLTVLSGTTSINVIKFQLPDSAFKTNYITFPNATSDPSRFWIVSEKTVTNEKTIEKPWQNLTFYKRDLVNNKLELFTTIVTYTNPNRYPTKNITSFLDQSIFNTNRFEDYPSYGDFFTKWNITTSQSTNIFFKESFETFTIEKANLDLFSFKINYSDGSSDIFPYKLNNSSFINNLLQNGLLTTGDDVTSNPLLNWNIFYDNPNYNDGLIFFEKTFQSTSIDKDDSNLFSLEITSGGQIVQTINYSFPKSIITDNILIENLSDESIASGVNINSNWNTFYDNPIENTSSSLYNINNLTFDKSDLNLFSVVVTRNDFSVSGTDSFKLNDNFFETNVVLDQLKDEVSVSGANPNLYWGVYYDNPIQEIISGAYDFNDITFNRNNSDLFSIKITETSQFNNDLEIVSGIQTFKLNDIIFNSNRFPESSIASGNNSLTNWEIYHDGPSPIDGLGSFNDISANINLSKDDVNFSSIFVIEKSDTCVSGAGVSTQFYIGDYQYYEFEKNSSFNLSFDYEILTPNLNINDISFKIIEFYSSSGVDLFNEIASFTLSSGSVSQGQYYNANFNFNTTESSTYRFLVHFNNYDQTNINLKIKNLYVGRFDQLESFKTYNTSLEFINDFYISNPNLPPTFFFYLSQLNNKLKFTSLAFTEFNNIYKMEFINVNSVLNFLFDDNDYIKDKTIYNPRIHFKKDPIDYKTILTKNYSPNSGGGITTNFLLPSELRNSELKINFESEIISDYFNVNDIDIEVHEYTNVSGTEVLNLIDSFTMASGTINQNFSFNSTSSEFYAFRIDFKNQNTKNIELKLNDFYIGTDNFNETTKTYNNPSQFIDDFYISNPNIPLTYYFYLSQLNNQLNFNTSVFTQFNNIYKIEFININPALNFLFEDNNYMKDGIIYNPRFYFKKDSSDYKTFLFKNYSPNLGGGINTEFLINNEEKQKPLKLEFNYQILSDNFNVNDVYFKIIENYVESGLIVSNEIASFILPNGSIVKNQSYLASFEFNSTNSSIYKLEVTFESSIPKTTQLKISNFYVGQFSLNRNQKTYVSASDFVSDFNTNNFSSSFFNLSSKPNNKISFTTTIFNDNPNISKLEFTNVNTRINWLFSDNFVIKDYEINNPNISFYRDSDKKTILLKKYSNILKGGVSTDFIISEFNREQTINLQFNYIVISNDFNSNDITFQIVTFDDNNQERIVKSFNLTDITPNQEKFANFNFVSSFNDSRYRLKIKFTNEIFKELKIKVSNFYVGKYSLNQNAKTYYRPQEFINDFIKSNNIPSSYLFYLNEINNNDIYEMSFFSSLFNQYVNIDKIEFININNKLNWFFESNSIFNSDSNSEISNPQISFSKDRNGGYILHKRDSKILGGSIFTDFIISDFEKNNSNFKLNFDYELPNNFDEDDIKISIRKIDSNETLSDFVIQNIKLNVSSTKFEHTFSTSTNSKYRLFINFSNESIKDIKIKLNNFYVGRYSLLQSQREYSNIDEFLYDFNLINKISKSGNYYFDKSNSKLIFYNNFFEDNNVVNIRFDRINSSLNWFFINNESQNNLIINNSTLSFTRNNSNEFLLYKNRFNLLSSTIHHSFIISNEDKQSNLKINFNYKIISQNFSKSFILIEIRSIEQNNQEKTLKTFELSSVDPNVELSFNGDFKTTSSANYKLVLKINDNTLEIIQMTFKNFYTGKNVFNQNVVTFNNPKDFIKNIISSDEFNNFKGFTISYNSTDINQETNQDLGNTVSYKMSFNSEPYYTGSRYSFKFTDVHPKLKWFFYDLDSNADKTYTGKDFIQYIDSGSEVKYYDLFINLSKAVFSILNSYALSRLIVPEAFDEENNIFPAGTNIPFNYKQYYSELVDDLTIDFKEKFVQDPRSNFTKVVQNRDFPTGPNWKKASIGDALGLKDLSKIKSVLNTVKSALKTIKSILDAIKRFIEILEELIELASDIIGALLNTVITQLEKIVDNIGSTGFYFLPIIEYYSISDKAWWFNSDNFKDTAFEQFVNSPYPGQSNVSITNQFTETMRQLRKTNDAILGESLSLDQENLGKENKFFTGWKAGVPGLPFRSTTYDEFIEVIIDALLDPEDLPELGLRAVAGEKDNEGNTKNDLALFSNNPKRNVFTKNFPASKNIIRPGAPKWSAGSQSKVIVFAVNFPAPEDIIYGLSGGWELFLTSIYPVLKSINYVNQLLIANDDNKTIKQRNENAKKYNEEIKTKKDKTIKEIKTLKDEINETLNPIVKKIDQKKKEFKEKLKDRNDYIKFQQGKEVTVEEKEDIEKEIEGFEKQLKEIDEQHSKLRQEYTTADTSLLSKRNKIKELKESLIPMSTYGFSETIEGWVESIEQQLNINEILKEDDTEEPKPEVSKSLGEIAGDTAYNIYESTLKPTIDTVADIYEDPYRLIDSALATRKNIFSGTRGTYPDFYGFTLGSIFPGVYSYLKGLLKEARNLNEEETDSTLSEEFQELIEPIENFIKKIEKMIRKIDAFLDLIDAILNISVSYLVIDSKNGVEDIIQQLRNAEGFPLEEKRQVILGGLIGAGGFDPNSTGFNLSGYFKESMAEFNESAGEMFDELNLSNEEKGIGFLSKIFKTPKVDNPTGVDSIGGA